jgi:choloylglycine hydrolase
MKLRLARTLLCLLVSALPAYVWSCTGIGLKAKDGSFINGRTVEFGMYLNPSILVVPKNYDFKGTLPDGSPGLNYRSKYAAVGLVAFSAPQILDGMNEKGLTAAIFFFPGYASYTTVTPENKNQGLSPADFSNWILTQFASVDEVKAALKSVVITPTPIKNWGGVPPFHYIVYEKSGKSIVIEPVNGQLKVYDNPIGVITNSPTFDWHLTNLSNYINLSPNNAPVPTVDGLKLKQLGQGSGLHGLPGDFSPPSRFVRAAIFETTAVPSDNAEKTVFQVFHILNQFDIPVGSVREVQKNQIATDYTIITSVKDPQNLKYYFKTYDNQSIQMINLAAFDANATTLKEVAIQNTQSVADVSASAK